MDIKPSEKSIYKELRVNMWQYFHYSELAGDALNEDSESTSCHVCVCGQTHTPTHTVDAQWSSALRFVCSEEAGRWTLVSQGSGWSSFLQGTWPLVQ